MESEWPELEECSSILANLLRNSVAQLFFEYDSSRPEFPTELFVANPNLPNLSDVQTKLLNGNYESGQQFCEEVIAIFDTFLTFFENDIGGNGRLWHGVADHLKTKFVKHAHAASSHGRRETIEEAARSCRHLLDNPFGERFEQSSTMETRSYRHDMLGKINPRRYY
jgi:hypothetical protein